MAVLIITGNASGKKVRSKVVLYGIGLIRALMQSLRMEGITGFMVAI
jgi:hypothetical protein